MFVVRVRVNNSVKGRVILKFRMIPSIITVGDGGGGG